MRQVTSPCFPGAGPSTKEAPASLRHIATEEPLGTAPEVRVAKGGALSDTKRP